jgi:hypothetical protein
MFLGRGRFMGTTTEHVPTFRPVAPQATMREIAADAEEAYPRTDGPLPLPGDHSGFARVVTDEVDRLEADDRPVALGLGLAHDEITPSLADLDFGVHVSMRYHARRRSWYDHLHRLMILVIAVGASAGVAAIHGGLLDYALYLSIAVAAAGGIELAFSLPERARIEDALYRRFNALAAEIAEAKSFTAERLHVWEARRLLIRADADDRHEVLRRICHNLEAEARDYSVEAHYRIWAWQRLFAQLCNLPPLGLLRARR